MPTPLLFRRYSVCVVAISLTVYAIAMALPIDSGRDFGGGAQLFVVGLAWCWFLPVAYSWWANVLYWVALSHMLRGRWKRAAIWSQAATLLATAFLLPGREFIGEPVFWVWVGAMAILNGGALTAWSLSSLDDPVTPD